METPTIWGMIDARHVVFPARARDLNSLVLIYAVPYDRVEALLVGDAYEPIVGPAGTVDAIVTLHEYRVGPWGPCNSCDVSVPVRPVGAPPGERDGFVLPDTVVNRRFNGEVAYWSMGIDRRFGTVEVVHDDGHVAFVVKEDDELTLRVGAPAVTPSRPPERYRGLGYSYVDGEPYAMPFDIDVPRPHLDPTGVEVELGRGRLAETVAALGAPRPPDAWTWGTALTCTLHAPRPIGSVHRRAAPTPAGRT
jgi:hypothetical protein